MATTILRHACLGLLLAGGLGACDNQGASSAQTSAPPAVEESPPTLSLRAASAAPGFVAVEVSYRLRSGQAAPRMMELYLRYSDGLDYQDAEPLAAVTTAGKELVVQDQGGGLLRVIVYASTNTTTLASGGLARITFQARGASSGTVSLESRMPIFAPAEANDGVLLGPPVKLSTGQGSP